MKQSKAVFILLLLCLGFFFLLILRNNQQTQNNSGKCGIENCHGLDISCGPNIAQICDEMFMVGDQCRKYVSCQTKDGECQLISSSEFDGCKSCVEECKNLYKDDGVNLFECAGKCSE